MPRYKPAERNGLLLPVVLSEQIQPGSFKLALDHLVEHELDLRSLNAKFNNDQAGASAYGPRAMLKIVLLASLQPGPDLSDFLNSVGTPAGGRSR